MRNKPKNNKVITSCKDVPTFFYQDDNKPSDIDLESKDDVELSELGLNTKIEGDEDSVYISERLSMAKANLNQYKDIYRNDEDERFVN